MQVVRIVITVLSADLLRSCTGKSSSWKGDEKTTSNGRQWQRRVIIGLGIRFVRWDPVVKSVWTTGDRDFRRAEGVCEDSFLPKLLQSIPCDTTTGSCPKFGWWGGGRGLRHLLRFPVNISLEDGDLQTNEYVYFLDLLMMNDTEWEIDRGLLQCSKVGEKRTVCWEQIDTVFPRQQSDLCVTGASWLLATSTLPWWHRVWAQG